MSILESGLSLLGLSKTVNNLKGIALFYDNLPAGLAVWEMPSGQNLVANAMASSALRTIPGISEHLHRLMAADLYEHNVPYICIVCSETQGLDFFKRKFAPAQSIKLMSIQASKVKKSYFIHRA
jgi:hypothetical protein